MYCFYCVFCSGIDFVSLQSLFAVSRVYIINNNNNNNTRTSNAHEVVKSILKHGQSPDGEKAQYLSTRRNEWDLRQVRGERR